MKENLSLLVDLYEFTMSQSYFLYKKKSWATFDLFVRALPPNRAYLVSCGLEDLLEYIRQLKFTKDDISFLKSKKIFSDEFLRYLRNFRFRGDIWAIPEGEIFFAQEPMVRVTAPIIEAQLIESYFLNTVNLQTMIASKASRVVNAGRGRDVIDFSLRRTHGAWAGIKVARCAYIAGCQGTSNVLAGKLYNIPVSGTMAHSFVAAFKKEKDSFLSYVRTFPDKSILLVDTYNVKEGIKNAISVGLELKCEGHRLLGIRLDSGDIVSLSKLARKMLDRAGLEYVKILATGNLDEFKIEKLLKRGACVDSFGVGTNMGVSTDAPSLDVIYKLSEVTDGAGRFLPTMKLSKAKATYPGRKQVIRQQDKNGKFIKDVLALEKEKIPGRPLLIKVVDKGNVVYNIPSLDRIRCSVKDNLARFSTALLEVFPKYKYPVVVSPGLKKLHSELSRQLMRRQ
ncbi:MAG: nicotinate phosphoribosyltransferase [Candidatus Omnitrophica bacterium]|nr:nicotinate phosphoribosyltransferase [Candidatus Omnitrophota bacterium]